MPQIWSWPGGCQDLDLVVSIFGAMFAPRPFDVAKEMVRVTRPGGRIVMGNWIPGDPTLVAQILKTSSGLFASAAGRFCEPRDLGRGEQCDRTLYCGRCRDGEHRVSARHVHFPFPGHTDSFLDVFRHYYGPTMNAFEAAEKQGRAAELQKQLEDLFNSQNKSQKGTSIPATFLRVTISV